MHERLDGLLSFHGGTQTPKKCPFQEGLRVGIVVSGCEGSGLRQRGCVDDRESVATASRTILEGLVYLWVSLWGVWFVWITGRPLPDQNLSDQWHKKLGKSSLDFRFAREIIKVVAELVSNHIRLR